MSEQDAEILEKLKLIQDNVEKLKKASKLIMADYKRKLLSSNLASTSSYLNIDSDGYSVSRDFIQIYNGSFLTCPSLTIMGSFILLENEYYFVDAESKVRGILKIMKDNCHCLLRKFSPMAGFYAVRLCKSSHIKQLLLVLREHKDFYPIFY